MKNTAVVKIEDNWLNLWYKMLLIAIDYSKYNFDFNTDDGHRLLIANNYLFTLQVYNFWQV